ncbi:iron-containing alcohol dehydrogenase [Acinetobacter chinensis]|uniref:Iron-containing alcohol dehydrogenase n=1 Tax=Acinetobacter chinensis TaxID=2004650 RepID=A0A3B7M0P9_9GAMM|nr:iron-containing alcohol dehydrogenase [Acinetobacter chinensis]AXY56289.1 iron-containing alcohol dehydrogenase [Acinetobacter chinensis]
MPNLSIFKSAGRLVTGRDALDSLQSVLEKMNAKRAFIITDQGVMNSGTINRVLEKLNIPFDIYDQVNPEPELEQVERCIELFHQQKNDVLIAVGGGSAMDVAKCTASLSDKPGTVRDYIGLDTISSRNIPLIAIPTTSGTGSEVTNVAILSDTAKQTKEGFVSEALLPDIAIVSPYMSLTCPASVTAASGVDALVHAVESYISLNRSEITDGLALKAIQLICEFLPQAYTNPEDLTAREKMATASLIAGLAFGNGGVGAVHALAYPLGGKYKMSHGVSNALMLPYVMKWNAQGCEERFTDIAVAMRLEVSADHAENVQKVVAYLHDFCRNLNIPSGLKTLNIPFEDIPYLAEEAINVKRLLKNNPRVLSLSDIEEIYREAY